MKVTNTYLFIYQITDNKYQKVRKRQAKHKCLIIGIEREKEIERVREGEIGKGTKRGKERDRRCERVREIQRKISRRSMQ